MTVTVSSQGGVAVPRSRGLPRHYYFSDEVFAHELDTLWSSTWQFVGRASEIHAPGDYLTYTAGRQPLVVVRTESGALRAMHNVCPHRGARILDGRGNCRLVQCPYHAWSFDLEGKLRGLPRPERFADMDRAQVGLAPARVATWGGFVFVHPEPEGEPLERYLAGFPAFLEGYEQSWEELREVDRWHHEEPVNWKFVVENYRECYHLPVVHAKSLDCFEPGEIRYTPTGQHYQIFVPYTDDEAVERHPSFSGRPQGTSYQGHVFPNLMFNTAKDMVSVFRLIPLTPERTRFDVIIYQTPAQMELYPYAGARFRPEFDQVLLEDFYAVRRLQEGVRSTAYRVNLADTLEYGISHFHAALASFYPPREGADASR